MTKLNHSLFTSYFLAYHQNMKGRGAYAKGTKKREEILQAALRLFASDPGGGPSLREIAQAVGLTQAGVLHHFESKEHLYTEVLAARNASSAVPHLGKDPFRIMVGITDHNSHVPGLGHLFATMSVAAVSKDHTAHDFFQGHYSMIRGHIEPYLKELQRNSELDPALDAQKVTTMLIALLDGLQIQFLYDKRVNMVDHLEYMWMLLRTHNMEGGWHTRREGSAT